MKKNALERIIHTTLKQMIKEQAEASPSAIETDNAPSSAVDSPFTPAEERFLGKFDAFGSTHLGIIYSPSITGIREFVARSGKDLNVTPGILLSLLRKKVIKLVPYTGFGRNDDYTIELQLSLDDVKGLGDADKATAEKGSSAAGAPMGGTEMSAAAPEPPAPENAGYMPKSNNILKETLLTEGVIAPYEIKLASNFWMNVSNAMDSWDWKEDTILAAFKTIKNRKQAIITDAVGTLFYKTITSSENRLIKVSKYLTNVLPAVPETKGEKLYTILRLCNNTNFKAWVIEDYGRLTDTSNIFTKHLNNAGIGRYNSGYGFYATYTNNDILAVYNQLIKQVTSEIAGPGVTPPETLAAAAKPYKAKIENNRANYANKSMPIIKLESIKNIDGKKVIYKGMWVHPYTSALEGMVYAWYQEASNPKNIYRIYKSKTGPDQIDNDKFISHYVPITFGTNKKGDLQIRTNPNGETSRPVRIPKSNL